MSVMREDEVLHAWGERLKMAASCYNRMVRAYQAGEIRLYDVVFASDGLRHVIRGMQHDHYRVRVEYREPEPEQKKVLREVARITVTGHGRGITIRAKKKGADDEAGTT